MADGVHVGCGWWVCKYHGARRAARWTRQSGREDAFSVRSCFSRRAVLVGVLQHTRLVAAGFVGGSAGQVWAGSGSGGSRLHLA